MKKLFALLSAVLLASCASTTGTQPAAQQTSAAKITSTKYYEIDAVPSKVWALVKDFDSLHKWHPVFANDVLKSGSNGTVGTVRELTVKDGPSFSETLLEYSDENMRYKYNIIDPTPLPLENYVSEIRVSPRGHATLVTWTGTFTRKAGGKETDADVKNFIDGVYDAGLRNLRNMAQAN